MRCEFWHWFFSRRRRRSHSRSPTANCTQASWPLARAFVLVLIGVLSLDHLPMRRQAASWRRPFSFGLKRISRANDPTRHCLAGPCCLEPAAGLRTSTGVLPPSAVRAVWWVFKQSMVVVSLRLMPSEIKTQNRKKAAGADIRRTVESESYRADSRTSQAWRWCASERSDSCEEAGLLVRASQHFESQEFFVLAAAVSDDAEE